MPNQHGTDAIAGTDTGEQAIIINAPLEAVEAGWVKWCASGHAKLRNDYAIRFEPASEAQGTEVHLSGGGSASAVREELSRFKHQLELKTEKRQG
jgi:hypothetical protein